MNQLLEELSDLEHRQWMYWSKYVADEYDIPEELEEKRQEILRKKKEVQA